MEATITRQHSCGLVAEHGLEKGDQRQDSERGAHRDG
jgi:hypothetical protein